MVLDFGKGSLFRPSGLEQDTGLLKERWGQDGSVIINASASAGADATVYTVTAGKRLFVNYIFVQNGSATNVMDGSFKDGGAGGTEKQYFIMQTNYPQFSPNLSTPLYFDTDVFYDRGSGNGTIIIAGWEEDAE